MKQLELIQVGKKYMRGGHHLHAIEDVSFHVDDSEFVCIVGPSGCGKSALLRILAGLEEPTSGQIRFHGDMVRSSDYKIGMVFQTFALYPWRTVLKNIEFGLEMESVSREERSRIARWYVELMGLKGHENAYPRELSGGMRQRVGFARALAADPDVVLLDEPFSALDEFTAQTLRWEIEELWEDTEKTFLMVTHNLAEAIELADRVLVLSSHPGKIKKSIDIQLKRPRDRTDPEFVRVHKSLFEILKQELENTVIRHKLREIHETHNIEDIET